MKKVTATMLMAILVFTTITTSCNPNVSETMKRKTVTVGSKNAVVGDIKRDGIEISIPSNSVDKESVFSVQTATNPPAENSTTGILLGKPYEIDIKSDFKRFNRPLTLKFQLSDKEWESLEYPMDTQIAYHDGNKWDYLMPSNIDKENHTISFNTYHCSFLSPAKPTELELMNQVAHEMAVESITVDKNAELKKTTESLVKSVMGNSVDKSLLQDIVEGMMDQNDYTQLLKAAATGNTAEFETQFISTYTQVTANTLWAYSAAFADNLGDMGANLGLIGAFGTSASFISDGNFQAVAEELAKGIIQTHPLGKLFMTAANVTNRQIARWKNQEIEAAYQIYLNGKDPTIPFWGYGSIDPGDFNEIWNQMRGVSRQIIIDAVEDFKSENGREPSKEEKAKIESDAKKTLKTEFENRKNSEIAIAEAEKKNLEFLEILKNGNLLTKDRYDFDPEKISYKSRVRQLLELRNKVLVDTKRKLNFSGEDTSEEINAYTVSRLITTYVRDGEEAYNQTLIEEGLIEGFDLSKAAGTYKGVLTFSQNNLNYTKENTKKVSGGKVSVHTVETCNTVINNPEVVLNLSADGKVSISYTVHTNGTKQSASSYSYPDGKGYNEASSVMYNFAIEETFKNLKFKTAPGALTKFKNVVGNRYKSGTENHNSPPQPELHLEFNREYVSAYMESLTGKIEGSNLIITGKIKFEYPLLGVTDKPIPATFKIDIAANN